jgi:hypothetical protein
MKELGTDPRIATDSLTHALHVGSHFFAQDRKLVHE